jgi:HAD superfamily hydrolase (TIGR01549 family)
MHSKAIFFDVYQTLLNVDAANGKAGAKTGFEKVIVPYLQQRGVTDTEAALVEARYSEAVKTFYKDYDIELYQHSFPAILSAVFGSHYGLVLSEAEMSDLLYEFRKVSRGYLNLYEGVPEALEKLSKEYILVVASFTQGVYTERELEELGIRKYFTHCMYSSDIGFKKKSNIFWQKCLESVGLDPKNCAMVGDNLYEDMFMAHQNGLHTVWILNPLTMDKIKADIEPEARLPIESMRDLPDLINKVWNT